MTMTPRGSTSSAGESWYTLRAKARGVVDLMLYGDIGAWGITANQFARDLKALGDVSQINLHIHSPGGDVFEGMAMYNLLKAHPARIEGFVDGLAASMGSVILMACDTISMPENAMIMVHKPWGIQGGDAEDLRRYADLLDKVEDSLVMAYVAKTGKTADEIHALLKDETWMNGTEAVVAGFADIVIEPIKAAAHMPARFGLVKSGEVQCPSPRCSCSRSFLTPANQPAFLCLYSTPRWCTTRSSGLSAWQRLSPRSGMSLANSVTCANWVTTST